MATGRAIKATTVEGASPSHSSTLWTLPVQQPDGSWKPGRWVEARKGQRVQYRSNGLHLCSPEQLGYWVRHFAAARQEPVELIAWVVEYEGAVDVGLHGIAVRRARLVRPYVAGEAL
jgi:hypothetical protein